MEQVMVMARNNNTSIDFWLSQTFTGLTLWIKMNNRLNKK